MLLPKDKFYQREQAEGDSLGELISAIRKESECNFGIKKRKKKQLLAERSLDLQRACLEGTRTFEKILQNFPPENVHQITNNSNFQEHYFLRLSGTLYTIYICDI